MRTIEELQMSGPPFEADEISMLLEKAGPMDGTNFDDADESLVDKYAEHVRNYLYNYKPDAQNYDPNATPEEEHIGPMAQDLEQVNPDVVDEFPDGTKTLDIRKLALMNAGVIGDLCRRVQAIEDFLEGAFNG